MNSSKNHVVTAKARAMYGKRITKKQYEDLINCNNVPEVASYLKSSTYYSKALENINESSIHRGQLELLIKRHVFESYSKIYHYISTSGNDLFYYIIEEFVLREILRMTMLLNAGAAEEYIINMPSFLISYSRFDLMELAKVRSFEDLLHLLSGSEYEETLRKFLPAQSSSNIDYEGVEHALYEIFFRKLFHMINSSTGGTEKQELNRLLGLRLDFLNLTNLYRTRILLGAKEKDVIKSIFPFHHKITKDMLYELLTSNNKEQADALVKKWLVDGNNYLDDIDLNKNSSVSNRVENYTQRLNFRLCKNYFHLSQNISTVFYSFFLLSQIELYNIIYIIEGIRYKIPHDDIKRLIIQ